MIRPCRDDERAAILAIVNAAAEAYRGVIPADRWHEPYMPRDELDGEIAAGVRVLGLRGRTASSLGVMGLQPVRDVELIRHAYVAPGRQRGGVGGTLLEHLAARTTTRDPRRHLGRRGVGRSASTSATASQPVARERTAELLRTYWTIPDRQIETSVVLARPPYDGARGRPVSPTKRARSVLTPDDARGPRVSAMLRPRPQRGEP